MDQGAHRRGAFHGVGQPIQRNLRRLPSGAQKEQEGDRGGHRPAWDKLLCGIAEDLAELDAAESDEDQEDPQDKPKIPYPIDDEGLLPSIGCRLTVNQKPIKRYEHSPTPSHPRNINKKLFPMTRRSMEKMNRFR